MGANGENDVDRKILASEARSDARLTSIEGKMDVQFAQLTEQIRGVESNMHRMESEMHRVSAETIKWVAGIVISASVLGLTVMTFVLNNAVPKPVASMPAPIVITIPAVPPAPR